MAMFPAPVVRKLPQFRPIKTFAPPEVNWYPQKSPATKLYDPVVNGMILLLVLKTIFFTEFVK